MAAIKSVRYFNLTVRTNAWLKILSHTKDIKITHDKETDIKIDLTNKQTKYVRSFWRESGNQRVICWHFSVERKLSGIAIKVPNSAHFVNIADCLYKIIILLVIHDNFWSKKNYCISHLHFSATIFLQYKICKNLLIHFLHHVHLER